MQPDPLVSIILPNYETDEYLGSAVDSVLNQTYDNFEVLLVDSSGTELVRDIAGMDNRIEYVYQDPNGLAAARNEGLDAVNGDFVAFQDADDLWREDKLERQISVLKSPSIDFVYSDEYILDGEERVYHSTLQVNKPDHHFIEFFRKGSGIPVRTVMARKGCFENHRFNEDLPAREDSNLWVRILNDFRPGKIDEPLATKVVRDDAMTADVDMMYRSELDSIQDLVEQTPQLERYEAERLSRTHYKYGKQLLKSGRGAEARNAALNALAKTRGHRRAYILLLISSIPMSPTRRIRLWDTLEESWRKIAD